MLNNKLLNINNNLIVKNYKFNFIIKLLKNEKY